MAKELTYNDYQKAIETIAKCLHHDMVAAAKSAWEHDDGLHAEDETFEQYCNDWLKVCMNDEFDHLDGVKESVRDEFRALLYKS